MAIAFTWRNLFVMAGLIFTILAGFVAGTATMMEWRVAAVQNQLADRLNQYNSHMEYVERRLERLEERAYDVEHKP